MKRIAAALFAASLATTALAADGAALFASKCKMCHGAEGAGSKMAPKAIKGLPAAEVKKVIAEGKGKMRPVKLDAADATAVADYVAGLKK